MILAIFVSLLILLAGFALCYMAHSYIGSEPAKTVVIVAVILMTIFVLLRYHHFL